MIKLIALFSIVGLRIFYQSPQTQSELPAFKIPQQTYSIDLLESAKFIQAGGYIKNDKVYLDWEISGNENADMFEIEKSKDGKNFSVAALVFGTNNAKTDDYRFYEKAESQKIYYRIKLINKNRQSEYSKIIELSSTN